MDTVKKILDTKYKMTILNEGRGFNTAMGYIEDNYKGKDKGGEKIINKRGIIKSPLFDLIDLITKKEGNYV